MWINVDLEKMVDIFDEWIVICIGICECYIVVLNEIVLIMGFEVVICVIEMVGIEKD